MSYIKFVCVCVCFISCSVYFCDSNGRMLLQFGKRHKMLALYPETSKKYCWWFGKLSTMETFTFENNLTTQPWCTLQKKVLGLVYISAPRQCTLNEQCYSKIGISIITLKPYLSRPCHNWSANSNKMNPHYASTSAKYHILDSWNHIRLWQAPLPLATPVRYERGVARVVLVR